MKKYRLDQYIQDATIPPFPLEVSDEETILIKAPDGDTVLAVEEATSSRARLRLLCGEQFNRVLELIGKENFGVMTALVMDMMRHFGFDLTQVPAGGSGASSS